MPVSSLLPGEVARYIHVSVYDFQAASVRDAVKLLSRRTIASPETWSLDYDANCEVISNTVRNLQAMTDPVGVVFCVDFPQC